MAELAHYGVLGMKWGVRRDNPSGSKKKSSPGSDDYQKARTLRKQGPKNLTNAELRTAVERMNLERQYKDLTKKDISGGQAFAQRTLKRIGDRVVEQTINSAVDAGFKLINKKK